MKWMTVLDKRTRVGNPIEGRLYRYLPFAAEFRDGVVRKKPISPSAVPRFNFRFEFVFLHCFSNRAASDHPELNHFPPERPTEAKTPDLSPEVYPRPGAHAPHARGGSWQDVPNMRRLLCETGIFRPAAIAAIRQFAEIVRKELGKAIFDVQLRRHSGPAAFSTNASRCRGSS